MSMTAVPISMRLVRAPIAASSGNGDANCRAKWCTRKYAPSAPSSSAATARSIDCSSASAPERTCDCGEGVQWPKERKPMFFMSGSTPHRSASFPRHGTTLLRMKEWLFARLVRPGGSTQNDADNGGLAQDARPYVASNGLRQIGAQACQGVGDQIVNAKTVLPWLLATLGAPGIFLALLVPVRESG